MSAASADGPSPSDQSPPGAPERSGAAPREWDGASYDRISAPMERLGRDTLERLPLTGRETVLDAGCGSGRVTEALLERVPQGHVIAIDASASMVREARRRLGERADVRQVDLLDLHLREPVDAILSTATFHWITDHARLYRRLHAALTPAGRLVAQCGGRGNVRLVHRAAEEAAAAKSWARALREWRGPWNFTTAEQAAGWLGEAGFGQVRCWLQESAVTPPEPHEYLSTIVLGAHLQRLAPDRRDAFVEEVMARLGSPLVIDYVRLNIDAVAEVRRLTRGS